MLTVYIVTNKPHGTLFIGLTRDIAKRSLEHKMGILEGFAKRYQLKQIVFAEAFTQFEEAMKRKRQLKHWQRDWKVSLIESINPTWEDLYPASLTPIRFANRA
jgi:putative endonuclease